MILDQTRLDRIRATVHIGGGPFLGDAVGTDDLANPPVALRGNDTQIQSTAVNHDCGVFDDPDSFYRAHPRNEHGLKGLLFRWHFRAAMNSQVTSIGATDTRVVQVT